MGGCNANQCEDSYFSKQLLSHPCWERVPKRTLAGPVIVFNILPISGLDETRQHRFVYTTSKAAAIGLTKMLAHEVVSSKLMIRVNNVAPGAFPSKMTTRGGDEKLKVTIPKREV